MRIPVQAAAFACLVFLVSGCSTLFPEQTLVVNTPEPGAEVHVSLIGSSQINVASQDFTGSIPTGDRSTAFQYVGETPLTHTFMVAQYQSGPSAAGFGSSNQSTFYREAVVRVIYPGGVVDERRVRLNHAELVLNFDGPDAVQRVGAK